jgi:hypothetical protein
LGVQRVDVNDAPAERKFSRLLAKDFMGVAKLFGEFLG